MYIAQPEVSGPDSRHPGRLPGAESLVLFLPSAPLCRDEMVVAPAAVSRSHTAGVACGVSIRTRSSAVPRGTSRRSVCSSTCGDSRPPLCCG